MRILISAVGHDSGPTGICRVAASHTKALLADRLASQVSLVVGSWQRELFEMLLGPYATQVDLLVADIGNNSISRNVWYTSTLPRLAKELGADLVHLTYPAPTFRRTFRGQFVVTLHDLYPYDMPENFGFPNYFGNRAILRQCLSAVDGVACVSNSTRSRLEEKFPGTSKRVPTVVTGNYVESPSGDRIPPASLEGVESGSFVLTVAQHRKNKNLSLLLRGFKELANGGSLCGALVVVGSEGPETRALHQLSKSLGISERLTFIQSVSETELHWLYANCSLFVICSTIEGYCLPLAEAMANQARIVCSDIPILREIGDTQCSYFSLDHDPLPSLVNAMKACVSRSARGKGSQLHRLNSSVLAEYVNLYLRVNRSSMMTYSPQA